MFGKLHLLMYTEQCIDLETTNMVTFFTFNDKMSIVIDDFIEYLEMTRLYFEIILNSDIQVIIMSTM